MCLCTVNRVLIKGLRIFRDLLTFKVPRERLIMLIKLSIWLPVSVAEGPISLNLGPYLVPFFIACRLYSYWNLCLGCKSNEVKVGVRGWLVMS